MISRPPYLTHPALAAAGCICMFNRYVDEIKLRDNEPRLHSVALPLTFHYSCCSLTPSPTLCPSVCSQQCANQIINCSQWRKSFRAELQHCHHQPRGHGDLSSPFAHNSRFGKTRCFFFTRSLFSLFRLLHNGNTPMGGRSAAQLGRGSTYSAHAFFLSVTRNCS